MITVITTSQRLINDYIYNACRKGEQDILFSVGSHADIQVGEALRNVYAISLGTPFIPCT